MSPLAGAGQKVQLSVAVWTEKPEVLWLVVTLVSVLVMNLKYLGMTIIATVVALAFMICQYGLPWGLASSLRGVFPVVAILPRGVPSFVLAKTHQPFPDGHLSGTYLLGHNRTAIALLPQPCGFVDVESRRSWTCVTARHRAVVSSALVFGAVGYLLDGELALAGLAHSLHIEGHVESVSASRHLRNRNLTDIQSFKYRGMVSHG